MALKCQAFLVTPHSKLVFIYRKCIYSPTMARHFLIVPQKQTLIRIFLLFLFCGINLTHGHARWVRPALDKEVKKAVRRATDACMNALVRYSSNVSLVERKVLDRGIVHFDPYQELVTRRLVTYRIRGVTRPHATGVDSESILKIFYSNFPREKLTKQIQTLLNDNPVSDFLRSYGRVNIGEFRIEQLDRGAVMLTLDVQTNYDIRRLRVPPKSDRSFEGFLAHRDGFEEFVDFEIKKFLDRLRPLWIP